MNLSGEFCKKYFVYIADKLYSNLEKPLVHKKKIAQTFE